MTAGLSDRRPVRIRRRGRHSSPSQVEKVALQAGKAAPAVAIAGALVAAPTAQHALAATDKPAATTAESHQATDASAAAAAKTSLDSYATRTVTVATAKATRHAATAKTTHYQVRSGDTLSAIAERYYHDAGDWQYLYHENDKTVSDPNLIYTGESLLVPGSVPANFTLTDYVPRHSRPAASAAPAETSAPAETAASTQSAPSSGGSSAGGSSAGSGTVVVQSAPAAGSYSCSALESLWDEAGGNSADAFMAAEIATAESGGNPNAISPTDDYGLWQINASNGDLATLNPFDNAKSAIILSDDGSNWDAWTTFTSGAYSGRC
jgi:LysM repeat protein